MSEREEGDLTLAERAIRAEIEAAFGGVGPVPAGAMLQPEFAGNDEAQELAAAFGGRRWSELSVDELFWHREFIAGLNGAGFRAYLPAYLAASLTHDPRRTADIQEYMLSALRAVTSRESDARTTRERLSLLDEAQRRAVASVLRYLEARLDFEPGALLDDWK
jgi:hypothetical protein